MPPMGAPKAAETPTAAAALSIWFLNNSFVCLAKKGTLMSNSAKIAAVCIKGPSFPMDNPAANARTRPTIFVNSTFAVMNR